MEVRGRKDGVAGNDKEGKGLRGFNYKGQVLNASTNNRRVITNSFRCGGSRSC